MDKEQARFILRSFRPDGADVDDHDFAEALALANGDRELGEWLAAERAFDAEFAMALASIEMPENLRDGILQSLAASRGDFPEAEGPDDIAMIGAFASIHPPAGLRDEILSSMERSARGSIPRKAAWPRLALPFAAAAGVALAFVFTRTPDVARGVASNPPAAKQSGPLPVELVQAGFIRAFESPLFSLDEQREDHRILIQHLKERELPCPGCLPPGLANVKGIGCRELVIDGKRGSLVCFDERENGIVHLVIFRRDDVCGSLPPKEKPLIDKNGHWASARWQDGQNVFILIANTDIHKLAALF